MNGRVSLAIVGSVSILDDARAGMNPDIRPQDDLFGHVNGRWLDEAEIPARPVELGTVRAAGRRRRGAGAARSSRTRRRLAGEPRADGAGEDARKIGDLYASFMDDATDRRSCGTAPDPAAARRASPALRDVRDLAAFLGEFERVGGARPVRLLRRHRRPQLRPLPLPPHPGRPRAARRVATTATTSSPRSARSTSPTSPGCSTLGGARRRRPARPRTVLGDRHPAGRGSLGARRDPRRAEDLQPDDRSTSCKALVPELRLGRLRHQPRRHTTQTHRRGRACGSRRTSPTSRRCSTRSRSRTGRPWLLSARAALAPRPYLTDDFVETNFDFYGRTLNGTPELRGALEARRRARRGRARRGRRQGVRRAALPAARPRR